MPAKKSASSNSFKCAYYGYKMFQAARVCVGDVTVVGEILMEAVAEIAAKEMVGIVVETALENALEMKDVVDTLGEDSKDLQDTADGFNKFAKKFDEALGKGNSPKGQGMMNEAQRVFASFNECDTDGSGAISRSEFIHFYAKFGFSETDALQCFVRADSDGNGEKLNLAMKGRCLSS